MRTLKGASFHRRSFRGRAGVSERSLYQLSGLGWKQQASMACLHPLQKVKCSQGLTWVTPTAVSGLKGINCFGPCSSGTCCPLCTHACQCLSAMTMSPPESCRPAQVPPCSGHSWLPHLQATSGHLEQDIPAIPPLHSFLPLFYTSFPQLVQSRRTP